MKRLTAITALCLLFSTAFVAGKGSVQAPEWPDSLRSVYLYTEGIKQNTIAGDSARAREYFLEAIRLDSTYAPAYYELGVNGLGVENMYATPDEAVELARTAYRLDTTNRWYHQLYGQTLIIAQRYREALGVYRRLQVEYPKEPDNYRLLAALYEQNDDPYMALATLDSAEMRFGRIPYLSAMKRQLLIATHQVDKAIEEARTLVEEVPYEAGHHVALAELYGISGKDSLAMAEYDSALRIDSANLQTLMSLADYHTSKRDYRRLLDVTQRLFNLDAMPLETKVRRFEQFTSDINFYRKYYFQLDNLASTLAIRYPNDPRVVELYAGHLIASGELEQALGLYKLHLADQPPVKSYFQAVIDIESYRQHADSMMYYVGRALELFPRDIDLHIARGNAFIRLKEPAKAIRAYRQSLRYAETDSLRGVIWGMIGDTWQQMAEQGNDSVRRTKSPRRAMKACYKAYDRSLGYWRDNAMVLNNYAYFLSLEGRDLEKALEMSSRALALTDKNATYLDTHAWVLYRLGRLDEAKKVIQQAVAFDEHGNADLLVHYGDILNALGERFSAEFYWQKGLDAGYDADEIRRRMESPKTAEESSR